MKEGIFSGLTMAQYLDLNAVSRSQLCLLGTRSPAHLKAQMESEKKKETKALRIGSLLDYAIFEPDRLMDSCHVRPKVCKTAKGCVVAWDLKTNDAQDWVAKHSDKPITTEAELENVKLIRESVMRHPGAARALRAGRAQQTLIVRARSLVDVRDDCEVMVRIRPDWLSGDAICDLKSTVDGSRDEFAKSIYNYGYDVQAALYLDVANLLEPGKEHFVFLCAEKEEPFAISTYRLDAASIEKGRMKYRYWLAQYCECARTGIWPGYSTDIEEIGLSDWAMRRAA